MGEAWAGIGQASPKDFFKAMFRDCLRCGFDIASDEEIHRVHELPHWKDLDNLHHKVSYHLSTKLVARKPPSN